jgi:hypothetical protein
MFTQTKFARLSAAVVLAATTFVAARADWTPWTKVKNAPGVEVSFHQVNSFVCTWKFRNNGTGTLRSFEYNYSFVPASPSTTISPYQVTRFDALDAPLKKGQFAGESLEFTAETNSCPTNISVQHISWERN